MKKISVIQMNVGHEKVVNLEQARALVDQAVAADNPDMVVLPETFASIGGNHEIRQKNAEPLPEPGGEGGAVYEALRALATKHGIFVHGGSFIELAGDRLFNTTVAFDREGDELARYRKIHLFDIVAPDGTEYKESASFDPGDAVVTYQAEDVTVGCSICYDLRFGELYRALAAKGATVIMVPAAFTLQTGKDHWEVLLRARAIETETYIVAAAQIGAYTEGNQQRRTWGHSMVVDPSGHIMAQVRDEPGFASANLDLGYLANIRQRIPVAQHRVL
ncbi:MAG: carbon-nitrogen hydrolase family protein [Alphaproteobacteria bacterium]